VILRVLDEVVSRRLIAQRRRLGQDHKDEVWDGVYVLVPDPTNERQEMLAEVLAALRQIVKREGLGRSMPGTNISSCPENWKQNFRVPDAVVVLPGSRAADEGSHWLGGPDFVVEIESPGDMTDEKIPFYSRVGVRELLVIHRDTRQVRLLRNDGDTMTPAEADAQGWFASAVIPLACRRVARGKKVQNEIRRTDGKPGRWTF
jgi:Uma2 family endonuclease